MKNKNKKRNLYPICYNFFWNFQPLLILLLTDIDHTLKPGRNASLLVLKDLQPSKSEKTNRPSLGILQKEILGYLFSQRTGAWAFSFIYLFISLFMFRGPWACTWAGFMWEPPFQLIMGFSIGPSSVGCMLSTSGKCVPYEK